MTVHVYRFYPNHRPICDLSKSLNGDLRRFCDDDKPDAISRNAETSKREKEHVLNELRKINSVTHMANRDQFL